MKVIATHELTAESMNAMSQTELLHIYNGLDCCVTREVLDVTKPQLDNVTGPTYEFSKSLQAPVLEMRVRGVLVDEVWRRETIRSYDRDLQRIATQLDRILIEGIGQHINWNSPAQLKNLLYRVLQLPVQKKRNTKGLYVETADRDALEKLEAYFLAQPIISHILALRDINKKIGVLKTSVDPDGRMRTSYNIAGTTTGRFSSSLSDFGTGTNLQNIEERLRRPFIADPGMKFAYIDLEQAESRLVGAIEWNLFGDGRYLDACESGDLHTSVCRLAWTELGWTGNLKEDRATADQPFYRQHSYRHMAKVLGHGTNYAGKPFTMAKHTKLEAPLISQFQSKYFAAFPAHQRWHAAYRL
jgi:DNA polymerase-1